jgi:hypothetical protein
MRRSTLGRLVSVVVLLAAAVAAVGLVSTPLMDHSTECGTAIDSARHGVQVPRLSLQPTIGRPLDGSAPAGRVTVCRNMAREHVAEAAAVIGIAVVAVDLGRRRPRQPATDLVAPSP